MKVLQFIGGIVLLFSFFSCTSTDDVYTSDLPDESVRLKYNIQKRVSDNLLLEVIGIEENRCPVGTVCSSPGYVEVEFRAFINSEFASMKLRYSDFSNGLQSVDTLQGYRVELVKVTPTPQADMPEVDPKHYSVSIVVEDL